MLKQWSRARERCCMLISPPSACLPRSLLPPGLPPPRSPSRLRRSLLSSGPAAAAATRFLLLAFPRVLPATGEWSPGRAAVPHAAQEPPRCSPRARRAQPCIIIRLQGYISVSSVFLLDVYILEAKQSLKILN